MKKTIQLATLLALPLAVGCGDADTANLRVTASDASALRQALGAVAIEDFDRIVLNVTGVRVKIDADEGAADGNGEQGQSGWYDLELDRDAATGGDDFQRDEPFDGIYELDLVALVNGGTFTLAEGEVPAGVLKEIRFVLAQEQGQAWPRAEGAVEADPIPVFVPSGSQSGLKLKGGRFVLEAGEDELINLEIDAEASLREHNDGAVRIRPVVRMTNGKADPVDDNGEPPVIG